MNMPLSHDRDVSALQLPTLLGANVIRVDGALDCVSKKVRYLHEAWLRMAGGEPPPDWSQFDIVEHTPVVANLYLIKRTAPREWTYTLRGEGVHEIFPRDKAAGRVADLHDAKTAAELLDYYETVAATGCCHVVRGTIINDRDDHVDIESIDCPFTDRRHGRHVILGVIERVATRPMPPLLDR